MRHRTLLWSIVVFLGVGSALVAACHRGPELSEEDLRARQDDTAAARNTPQVETELFPDTEAGRMLREHMMILALPTESPDEADRRYARSITELRKNPKEVLDLLTSAYRRIEPFRYYDRWALVKTLADLGLPGAYESLGAIARAPLPPEQNKDVHHFSTQEDEVMIRLRAVDGLGRLAASGHKAADANLLALATDRANPNLAIQARAIKAYLRAGRDYDARARLLKSRLPPDRHGVITLQVTPQVEFDRRVSALARVSDSSTTQDAAEERQAASKAPTVTSTNKRIGR